MSLLSRIRIPLVLGIVATMVPLVGTQPAGAAPGDPTINEVRIDQPGSDIDEFIELAGSPGAGLDGYTLVVIGDGSAFAGSGVIENVTPLDGFSIAADGLILLAKSTFSLGTPDGSVSLNFENSDNITMLLVRGFSGVLGRDLDLDDDGTLDETPWSEVVDSVALVESLVSKGTERFYSLTTVGPDGILVPGHVYRCADGFVIGQFDPVGGSDTPGTPNPCGGAVDPFGQCLDGGAVPISAVQGSGPTTPLAGDDVVIEGVVTADYQSTLELFFVQEEDANVDADAATSEGLAVFTGAAGASVAVGDVVRVLGTATERGDLTAIGPIVRIDVCTSGAGTVSPAVIHLPENDARDLEAFEGMLAAFPDELTVVDTSELGHLGQMVLSADGRHVVPAQLAAESASSEQDLDADGVPDHLQAGSLLLDDLSNDPVLHGPGDLPPYVNSEGTRRIGDTVTGLTAIVDNASGEYRLRPVGEISFADTNPRGAAPDPGGDVTIASVDVSNYFDTVDTGGAVCGPAGDQGCQGADSLTEFRRQQDKITSTISGLDADVVGLVELENNDTALDTLVAEIAGYRSIDAGPIGTDAVKVAAIYRPDTVAPVGAPAILDSSIDPRFDTTMNRPALAQTFTHLATGDRVTVVVTDLASRGGSCGGTAGSANEDADACDASRAAAATALGDWLHSDPTGEGDGDVLIVGDLDAYAMETPVATLEAAGFTDLLERFVPLPERYNHVSQGMSGYLDHGMANASLLPKVAGAAVWHINADEPRFNDYNDDVLDPTETSADLNPPAAFQADPYRSAESDPVLVGLSMAAADPMAMLTRLVDELGELSANDRSVRAAVRWLEWSMDNRFMKPGPSKHRARAFFAFHAIAARQLEWSSLDTRIVDRMLARLYEIDRMLAVRDGTHAALAKADALAANRDWAKALTTLGQVWIVKWRRER
jgi:uncharacterized protein